MRYRRQNIKLCEGECVTVCVQDCTRLPPDLAPNTALALRMEVAPADREAREDFNRFVVELAEQSGGPGRYARRQVTAVTVEARLPHLPLFHGSKLPRVSTECR